MIRTAFFAVGLVVALLFAGAPRAGAADLLANGGFEQGAGGWSSSAGRIESVSSPVHAGALAGRFMGDGQPTTQFAYQAVDVQPDETYELSGWVAASAPGVTRVFLRVSWFDAAGQLVSQSDSSWLPQFDGNFYPLNIIGLSPSATRWARVSAVIQADSAFTVHLDDFSLSGPAAIPVSPTPHPTSAPTPTSTVPSPGPTPTPRPAPTRTPRFGTSPAASPTRGAIEPEVFPALVNASFEELRDDSSPYGWRKQGGEITAVRQPRTDGARSLALTSQSSSTKWAYQTVTVGGGGFYQASVDALAGEGMAAAFLRISWYASVDGSGAALTSVDSSESASTGGGAFRRLVTDVVQAPSGAGSAKVRLMVRPVSDQPALAYFDAVAFSTAEPAAEPAVLGPARPGSEHTDSLAPGLFAEESAGPSAAPEMPLRLVNVKPEATAGSNSKAAAGGGQESWAIALAIVTAFSAIAVAGGYELWQRRIANREAGLRED